ncbi:MAG: substrate-binding domain-containing protein [Clostridium fessum]
MRKKKELVLWGILCVGLILLYLLSSTDWIIKEKEVEVYPVSLIISDTSDDDYVNFRKGVDQAAVEYNVDVSFITLYEKDNLAQQMELVRREAADGAGAVILEPVDELECRQYLEENTYGTPIILLGELSPDEEVKGAVHMDWTAAGRKLGEAITAEQSPDLPVWIFADNPYIGKAGEMKQGLTEVLEKQGFSYTIVPRGTDDTYRSVIEKQFIRAAARRWWRHWISPAQRRRRRLSAEAAVYGKYISGLYGVGMMPSLLDQLDKGTIRGLVVTNQFDAGYFAVKKAVQAIEKEQERSQLSLESYYIEKDELRSKKYEKMLYPID